jgi:hypothetical protein
MPAEVAARLHALTVDVEAVSAPAAEEVAT